VAETFARMRVPVLEAGAVVGSSRHQTGERPNRAAPACLCASS